MNMDTQALVQEFLGSDHGQNALSALTAQGISPEDAQTYAAHAAEVAHAQVNEQGGGLLGDHAGRNIFAGFASGLIRGDGLWGSVKDGLEGGLTGRVAESLAARVGIDPSTASGISAALTPFLTGFLKNKLGG
jgi:hypothetical protein